MNNFYKIAAILCMVLGAGRGEEVAPRQQARLGLIQHLPMPLSHIPPAPTHELSIGASPAVKGDFPFIVSLQVGNFHFCGGSIISHHTVLTAAHCMHDDVAHNYMEAVGGDYDLKISEGTEQRRAVARFTIHPNFTRIGITRNDVAVLFLKEPFEFNDYVKPIKLAHPGAISKGTFILSGWGVTNEVLNTFPDVLMREELPVVAHSVCADRMETPSLPDSILCTGPLAGGMGPCVGDSGGPLVQNGVLVGVVSWGPFPCGTADIPSGFTRVSAFTEWILVADRQLRAQQSSVLVHTLERNLPPGFPAPPRSRLAPAPGPAPGANHNPPFKGLS